MKMATGIFPLPDALAAGVRVALGTDGGLNNDTHDMFAEMKSGALVHNAMHRRAATIPATTTIELATINGARAIGRERELGSLEVGKLADIDERAVLSRARETAVRLQEHFRWPVASAWPIE